MSKSIEQKVKQNLKDIEKSTGIIFNRLLDTLFLERILVRISKSKYKKDLIFKGGMCLAQYLDLKRHTRDIDFLIKKTNINPENIKNIFTEICQINCNDGVLFSDVVIDQLSLKHKKYPGYRISIIGNLGQIKNKITIDIGAGDVVRPRLVEIELLKAKNSIFESTIELSGYPPEYIFSEKFEAILYLGEINGRMKDYFDCFKLINSNSLNISELKIALSDTFAERKTKLELIPTEYKDHLNIKWKAFLRKENLTLIPLEKIIQSINIFINNNGFLDINKFE